MIKPLILVMSMFCTAAQVSFIVLASLTCLLWFRDVIRHLRRPRFRKVSARFRNNFEAP